MGKPRLIPTVTLLAFAHVSCTAVGLWWLHRSTCATLAGKIEEQAFAGLERVVKGTLGSTSRAQFEDLKRRLTAEPGHHASFGFCNVSLTLVDDQWQIVASDVRTTPGSVVGWRPACRSDQKIQGACRGSITLANERHIAVASPLEDDAGHLIAHVPEGSLAESLSHLTSPLPAIALLTLLWTCVPVGVLVYMVARHCQEAMHRERQAAQADAMRQTYELVRTRDAIIVGLARLAESRDPETGDHLERIAAYSTVLAASLAEHPRFREQITPTFIKLIGNSSVLHDIGKVGVPDNILLKRGPLTDSERAVIQLHSGVGGRCLREIERRMGSSSYLKMAREVALHHHERWDGGGYPEGLSGDEIPLAARIVALADVYDALSTRRVYKEAFSHERCVAIIGQESGRQFDPDIVEVWLTIEGQYQDIAKRYAATRDDPGDERDRTPSDSMEHRMLLAAGSEMWR